MSINDVDRLIGIYVNHGHGSLGGLHSVGDIRYIEDIELECHRILRLPTSEIYSVRMMLTMLLMPHEYCFQQFSFFLKKRF